MKTINSSLCSTVDVSKAAKLQANKDRCFQGVIPLGKGFNVNEETAQEWIRQDPRNAEVVRPFSMGTNLAKNPLGQPDRMVIDFGEMDLEDAERYPLPFAQVKQLVKPERDRNRRDVRRINWWRYGENAPKMRRALAPLPHFFAVPRVSKWAVFMPMERDWLPGDLNVVFASSDFYSLGILSSSIHRNWMHSQKSTLKADIRYSHESCFGTVKRH